MKKKIMARSVPILANEAFTGSDTPPLLQRIYAARGVATDTTMARDLKALLPFNTLKGITMAVQILVRALQEQQRILIVGDFDADGATSTVLCARALGLLGALHVDYLVPNRFEFGYGLSPEIVAVAALRRPHLIITVDNGISSIAGVDAANALGIEVLITDHHLAGDKLPNASAIVNPNQPDCTFASKNLAGVGVIFYVMLALRAALREQGWFENKAIKLPNMAQLLDLVALGTVADVVPLDSNNRILVYQGIQRIRHGYACEGIQALLTVSRRSATSLSASDLGFSLGPRLNAAGRLDDMRLGIECLLSTDKHIALKYANELDTLNQERREIESDMQQQASEDLAHLSLQNNDAAQSYSVCLFNETWHQGVIGILAARIKEQFYRPTICFTLASDEQTIKGSARSIAKCHIRNILDNIATQHPGLISQFGGHAMAAGLSLPKDNFSAFKAAFEQAVAQQLSANDLIPVLYTDGALQYADFSLSMALVLREGGPWGQAFEAPLFAGYFIVQEVKVLGGKHLKLWLAPHNEQALWQAPWIEAILFNAPDLEQPYEHQAGIFAAYQLSVNYYKDRPSLQLIIEHLERVSISAEVAV